MDLKLNSYPAPSDYFGVLWGLSGVDDLLVLEHGSTGTCSYNVVNYMIMNKQSPKGKLFSCGMDEDDVVMGREDKLKRAVEELDQTFHPKIIALVATGVTSVIGLDLDGVIEEIQPRTNAKLLSFASGGFAGDYTWGIKEVFRTLAMEVAEESKDRKPFSVNVIGPAIDSFNNVSDLAELRRLLKLLGAEVNTVFTCHTSVGGIESMASASLNLVTRDVGLEAAQILEDRFGIPYVYGLPFGIKGTVEWLEEVGERLDLYLEMGTLASELERYGFSILELTTPLQRCDHLRAVISCPYDYALGFAKLMRDEWGMNPPLVVLPTEPNDPKFEDELGRFGVSDVLIGPDTSILEEEVFRIDPHVIFGNSYDLHIAKEVPIKMHAAFPAFDRLYRFDGTPFVGFRGHAYLTQTFVNLLNQNPEVFRN
ncbi:MAG: nitrogenase component 1 [Methanothrix sp.]|jgi:light-independent protochlorophyllide reductase B subunit|uniref:Oxidoreductase/nitrogenase component 1 n=1 Tax=Methanothrix harundinacea TaxID=301375 RepID=A0A101FTZ8_9EURY|nr:MAG: Oxidoreductase/nitrogenase component 1 [Methanothrix harundinacea]MCP1393440.1 nitrogenase component 1 [Methanothrix harundinacea]MDD2638529.1 nitrogenase component 1 [Methanothrix sp.]MDD5768851.1 nitrogenase component 1 [Methanothrix sp.]